MPEIARPSNFGHQLINPHAQVLTHSRGAGAVGFVRVSLRLRYQPQCLSGSSSWDPAKAGEWAGSLPSFTVGAEVDGSRTGALRLAHRGPPAQIAPAA